MVKEIKATMKTEKKKKMKALKDLSKKKAPTLKNLKVGDFDDFYVASRGIPYMYIMRPGESKRILETIETFALKIIRAARDAVHSELHHATDEGYDDDAETNMNEVVLEARYGSRATFEEKLNVQDLTFEECTALYRTLEWASSYGGEAWATIAEQVAKLEKMLPVFESNVNQVMVQIDHIIDLEHNTSLFMACYVDDFNLHNYLSDKSYGSPLFQMVSPSLKTIVERYVDDLVPEDAESEYDAHFNKTSGDNHYGGDCSCPYCSGDTDDDSNVEDGWGW